MATMKQIANLAGVSLGTVDRVLNNRGSVNAETAKRIMDIVRSLDYIPNKTARCLAARKLNIKIGCVIISSAVNMLYAQVEESIRKTAAELADYNIEVLIRHIAPGNPANQNRLIDELCAENIKGLVLCGYNLSETAARIDQLADRGIPVVTACTDLPDSRRIAHVGSNNRKSGRMAGQLVKLISGDCARIGIVVYDEVLNMLNYRERVDSFIEYIEKDSQNMSISTLEGNYDDDFKSYSVVDNMLRTDPSINMILIVSSGIYGACKAIERLPVEKRPKVVCFNCVPTTKEMLRAGIISATISPDPAYQGTKPLNLLFNLLCLNVKPEKEMYYADMDIVISESLSD